MRVIELAPPWVATDLDAGHPKRTVNEGMSPTPLPDCMAAAMQELQTENEELLVAGAKFLYNSGISDKLYTVFDSIN